MNYSPKVPDWVRSLNVGDTVCDCKFRHSTISTIEECVYSKHPKLMHLFLFSRFMNWLPLILSCWIDGFCDWLCVKMKWQEIVDRMLKLDNGDYCSAMKCCEAADHSIADHPHDQETRATLFGLNEIGKA